MMRGLRKLCHWLRTPREDPHLIGHVVRRGVRINGSWKYHQGEGVVTGSEVVSGRRFYRIQMGDHVSVCPLPNSEFQVQDRTSAVATRDDLPEVYWTAARWYQPGSSYSSAMRLVPGSPRWWRWGVWRALGRAYRRLRPPPEVHSVGGRARRT